MNSTIAVVYIMGEGLAEHKVGLKCLSHLSENGLKQFIGPNNMFPLVLVEEPIEEGSD